MTTLQSRRVRRVRIIQPIVFGGCVRVKKNFTFGWTIDKIGWTMYSGQVQPGSGLVGPVMIPEGRGEDVTARLVTRFKQLIRDGFLTTGCRLPAERELSQSLGVNRASLRQALKVLQVMGVLSQRVGDGTYLSSDARTFFREPLDFLILLTGVSNDELFGLRLLVEPELAAIAAKRASPQERADMAAALEGMKRSETMQERITLDLAFHEAIFRAAGNRACLFILVVIQRAVLQSMEDSASTMPIEEAVRLHVPVFRAIEKRDPAAARRAMARHLRVSRDSVPPRGAVAGQPDGRTPGKPASAVAAVKERRHGSRC
jgi:GntR family transcriptional repressor for pyruvate dehydrogenase complex